MKIKDQDFGNTTVLRPKGKITNGVGDVVIRNAVQSLLERGQRHVVLNLQEVTTIDSSGSGEIVSAYTTVTNRGGRMVLSGLPPKVVDILQIMQLITVFESYADEEEALRALVSAVYKFHCPMCGAKIQSGSGGWQGTCGACGGRWYLKGGAPRSSGSVEVSSLWFPTYEGEWVSVKTGNPTAVLVRGRLDLFASDQLRRAWELLAEPRRVLFDLNASAPEVSPEGLRRLAGICAGAEADDRVVVAWQPSPDVDVPDDLPLHPTRAAAVRALGKGKVPPPFEVTVELLL